MNYSNKSTKQSGGTVLAAILSSFAVMSACTEVDDRLGAGLLPDNQKMKVEVTTYADGVKTYLYREDSIPSSRLGTAYFGRTTDAKGIFGTRTSSFLVQFLPITLPYADNADDKEGGYGLDPIIDSMRIILKLDRAVGDTTQVQRFDVYEIISPAEPLHRDTAYYSNFPIERYRGEKLFEFSHAGRRTVSARLFPTAAGKEYMEKLVNTEWKDYTTDSLFVRKFQGLYITPAEGSPASAAIYAAGLASSGLSLHVRNHDTTDVSAIYDTLSTFFTFTDNDETDSSTGAFTSWDNVSINMIDFDYTGSVLGDLQIETNDFTDTLPSSPARPLVYVQAMGGVGSYLRFTDDFIGDVRNLRYDDAGQPVGRDIMINQAVMFIELADDSTPSMDASVGRLGSYLDLTKLEAIPDYQYQSEAYSRQSDASYRLPYNGYLNRSNGYYEIDITSYIQQLAKEPDSSTSRGPVSPAIYLAPEVLDMFSFGGSIMKGSESDESVKIRITYTIIKG